jgi:hypothetical protein
MPFILHAFRGSAAARQRGSGARLWRAALAVAAAACSRPPTESDVVGTYRVVTTGNALGQTVTLDLAPGNVARMNTLEQGADAPFAEQGTWTIAEDGTVRVVLARDGLGPVTTDTRFRLDDAALVAVAYDTARWGPGGFALRRD